MPAAVAGFFFRGIRLRAYLLLLAGLVIDLDHLLADPVYDPLRCSIGFHPLHTWPALILYFAFTCFARTRILGIGLLLHLLLDAADCLGMPGGVDSLLNSFFSLPWTQ